MWVDNPGIVNMNVACPLFTFHNNRYSIPVFIVRLILNRSASCIFLYFFRAFGSFAVDICWRCDSLAFNYYDWFVSNVCFVHVADFLFSIDINGHLVPVVVNGFEFELMIFFVAF